jgi:hypothetical protein
MCFSAQASFAAGAVLVPAGLYCTRVALRTRSAYLPLAVVPILFGLQQFAEGLVWVGLAREHEGLVRGASLGFLAFALGLWPFWVPFSVLCLQTGRRARWFLGAATLLGLALGCALYVPLALNPDGWLRVGVVHHSLRYAPTGLPAFDLVSHEWWDAGYVMLVLLPLLGVVSDRRFGVFFLTLIAAAAVSRFAFHETFVSVWCFFAALLSAQLCYLFSRLEGRKFPVPGRLVTPDRGALDE